jgi:hypothetical protein
MPRGERKGDLAKLQCQGERKRGSFNKASTLGRERGLVELQCHGKRGGDLIARRHTHTCARALGCIVTNRRKRE